MAQSGDAISGGKIYPFKWFFRPERIPVIVPVLQIVDDITELAFEQLPGVLAEIDKRHWGAIRQVLIEAKMKAEAMLRNDEIIKNAQLSSYYQGWVNYADYILANLEGLRAGEVPGPSDQGATPLSEP
jgi:hypothetical protein